MTGLAAVLVFCALAQVELHGGVTLSDPVVEVSIEGVLVGGEAPRTIGWDRARRVLGEHALDAEPFSVIAQQAWRARLRLARGDFALAEPLFADLFETYRNLDGPTALVVAEGLMRCRLARGDSAGAIEAWLVALRLRRAGQRLVGEPPIPPLIDEDTGLVPTLAPIFSEERTETPMWLGATDGDIQTLARWYASALAGAPAPEFDAETASAGVMLVAYVVWSQSERPAERTQAQGWLRSQLKNAGDAEDWREAWLRCALGLSLLADADEAIAEEALVHLSHLPARFRAEQPALTAVSLAAMIAYFDAHGGVEEAHALADDLRAVDPDHPALRGRRASTN
jgi:hypothetical protein